MRNYKGALAVLIVTAIIWIIADVVFSLLPDTGTISQAIKKIAIDWNTLPYIWGYLTAHFFLYVDVITFRRIRNILNVCNFIWLAWDLFNGIIGHSSFATCGIPAVFACMIGVGVGWFLWPQEA